MTHINVRNTLLSEMRHKRPPIVIPFLSNFILGKWNQKMRTSQGWRGGIQGVSALRYKVLLDNDSVLELMVPDLVNTLKYRVIHFNRMNFKA